MKFGAVAASAVLATSNALLADEIVVESFDAPSHTWEAQNDPVMGGKSTSTFTIADGIGTMNGTCAIVPSLSAPGFITARTTDNKKFPDISSCKGLTISARSTSNPANYKGYRVSFGSDSAFLSCGKFFARGFKADFNAGEGEFKEVQLPFDMFTKCWDDATGAAVKTCKDFPKFCPTQSRLADLQTISIWAEGQEGDVKLDIKKIGAYGCSASMTAMIGEDVAAGGALVTFDGAKETSFKFEELNDPVMGGKSTGTWNLGDGFGILDGEVVNVPSLKAPGFIKAAADGKFPDISAFIDGSLVLKVRTTTPEYAGYRVAFVSGATSPSFSCAGGGGLPFSGGCFKNKFSVPAGSDFVEVKLPFNQFTDKWSSATGEPTTTCADDKSVCPTAAKLAKIQRVEFWGEGANGKLHLEIQSVSAENAAGERFQLV